MSDPTVLVEQMLRRSRRKLLSTKNMAKGTWLRMTDSEILGRMRDELSELASAMNEGDWDTIADEAADVYHFASMGADPLRKVRKIGRPDQGGFPD